MNDKSADRVRIRTTFTGGIESGLDTVATIVVIAGAACVACVLLLGDIRFVLRLVSSVQIMIASSVTYVVLRGLAEIIRLLKRSNGLPYGGSLSKVEETGLFACGNCGAMVYNWEKCNKCGATINKAPASSASENA